MPWTRIWDALKNFIVALGLDDKSHWACEVADEPGGGNKTRLAVTKVFLNPQGIQFNIGGDPNGVTVIHAKPNPSHLKWMDVYADDVLVPGARMVFRLTGQILKPVIIILTFRPINGKRYRFDAPK